jgi:hypothetical protein
MTSVSFKVLADQLNALAAKARCLAPMLRPDFLICAAHHDLERVIRQRPLQRLRTASGETPTLLQRGAREGRVRRAPYIGALISA